MGCIYVFETKFPDPCSSSSALPGPTMGKFSRRPHKCGAWRAACGGVVGVRNSKKPVLFLKAVRKSLEME